MACYKLISGTEGGKNKVDWLNGIERLCWDILFDLNRIVIITFEQFESATLACCNFEQLGQGF